MDKQIVHPPLVAPSINCPISRLPRPPSRCSAVTYTLWMCPDNLFQISGARDPFNNCEPSHSDGVAAHFHEIRHMSALVLRDPGCKLCSEPIRISHFVPLHSPPNPPQPSERIGIRWTPTSSGGVAMTISGHIHSFIIPWVMVLRRPPASPTSVPACRLSVEVVLRRRAAAPHSGWRCASSSPAMMALPDAMDRADRAAVLLAA